MRKLWVLAVASLVLALGAGAVTGWSLNQQSHLRKRLAAVEEDATQAGDLASDAMVRGRANSTQIDELATASNDAQDAIDALKQDLAEVKPGYSFGGRNIDELDDDLTNVETKLQSLCSTVRLNTGLLVNC